MEKLPGAAKPKGRVDVERGMVQGEREGTSVSAMAPVAAADEGADSKSSTSIPLVISC